MRIIEIKLRALERIKKESICRVYVSGRGIKNIRYNVLSEDYFYVRPTRDLQMGEEVLFNYYKDTNDLKIHQTIKSKGSLKWK